jgi:thiol-disulfide isomerase/thioredoxin
MRSIPYGTQLLLVAMLLLQFSCNTPTPKAGKIIINLTDTAFAMFKGKKLYLGCFPHLIDSVSVSGKQLILNPNKRAINYSKLYAVLHWDDKDGQHYLRPIGFPSPYTKKRIVFSAFLIEDHDIEIVLDEVDVVRNATFTGSQRNEPHFKQVFLSYSTNDDAENRASIIKNNLKIIKQYPASGYIMEQLYKSRAQFTVDELKLQLAAFKKSKETQEIMQNLEAYYPFAGTINSIFPHGITLPDRNGKPTPLYNNDNYQLLVFWASWCAPCRAEIPELKKIFTTYGPKGLRMVSISIDKDTVAWKAALDKEQMQWPQFVANDTYLKKVEQYFTIPSIPTAFICTGDGKVIREFRDYPNDMVSVVDSIFRQ